MFFVLSKILWTVVRPLTLLALLAVAGLGARRLGWRRLGGGLVAVAALGFGFGEFTSLGILVASPLENRFPVVETLPDHVTGLIVLGGALEAGATAQARGQVLLNDSAERMTEAVALARRRPAARIAFTGFSGALAPEGWSEAEMARRFFSAMGVDPQRVVYEDKSRNTAENAAFLERAIRPGPAETWLLITSAAHMPRAVGCFRKVGWTVTPFPVDFTGPPGAGLRLITGGGLDDLGHALHEWIGLLAYRLTGRTDTLFPGP
jgi:uncharacterized SAM-binding protein YcdF (DUF218 family)